MQLGRYPHREIAGIGPLWFLASFPTPVDVIWDRIGESDRQLIERPSLEGQHIARVYHLAVKQAGFLVELDGCHIAVMGHRGHASLLPRAETAAPISGLLYRLLRRVRPMEYGMHHARGPAQGRLAG